MNLKTRVQEELNEVEMKVFDSHSWISCQCPGIGGGANLYFDKIQVSHKAPGAMGESGHLTLFTISLFHSKMRRCATNAGKKEEF
jgi:hypothetical protein